METRSFHDGFYLMTGPGLKLRMKKKNISKPKFHNRGKTLWHIVCSTKISKTIQVVCSTKRKNTPNKAPQTWNFLLEIHHFGITLLPRQSTAKSEHKDSPVSHCTLRVPTEKRSGITPPIELNGYLINIWIYIIFSSRMILNKCCVLFSSLELRDHCVFPIFLAFLFEISQRFFSQSLLRFSCFLFRPVREPSHSLLSGGSGRDCQLGR